MVSKMLGSLVLILAISTPVLMSGEYSAENPSFTSFVSGQTSHLGIPPPPPLALNAAYFKSALADELKRVTPSSSVSRKAYLGGYQTLSGTQVSMVEAEYAPIKALLEKLESYVKAASRTEVKSIIPRSPAEEDLAKAVLGWNYVHPQVRQMMTWSFKVGDN